MSFNETVSYHQPTNIIKVSLDVFFSPVIIASGQLVSSSRHLTSGDLSGDLRHALMPQKKRVDERARGENRREHAHRGSVALPPQEKRCRIS